MCCFVLRTGDDPAQFYKAICNSKIEVFSKFVTVRVIVIGQGLHSLTWVKVGPQKELKSRDFPESWVK